MCYVSNPQVYQAYDSTNSGSCILLITIQLSWLVKLIWTGPLFQNCLNCISHVFMKQSRVRTVCKTREFQRMRLTRRRRRVLHVNVKILQAKTK